MLGGRAPDRFRSRRCDGDIGGDHITVNRSRRNNNSMGAVLERAVIPPIGFTRHIHVVQVGFDLGIISPGFIRVELRNGEGREYPDDRYHDQQLDQGETLFIPWPGLAKKIGRSVYTHSLKSPSEVCQLQRFSGNNAIPVPFLIFYPHMVTQPIQK